MKKTVLTAVFTLLFTLAALTCIRVMAEEPPTYPADSLAEYLRAIGRAGDSEETEVSDSAFIRKIVIEEVPIDAGQYVEEVYRAHFEHDRRDDILSLESEQEVLYGSAGFACASYLCEEGGTEVHVLFLSRKKGDAMISFLALFEEGDQKEIEAALNRLAFREFAPADSSMPNCA